MLKSKKDIMNLLKNDVLRVLDIMKFLNNDVLTTWDIAF